MKRCWIEYHDGWRDSAMSYQVDVEADGEPYYQAARFSPPRPGPAAGKGHARFFVDCDGFTFEFSSPLELDQCVEVLSQKHLPSTSELSARRLGRLGPNRHWLSRLPARAKPWKYRQLATRHLARARDAFERERDGRGG